MEKRGSETGIPSSAVLTDERIASSEGQVSEIMSDVPIGKRRLFRRVWESLRKTAPYSSEAGQLSTVITWGFVGLAAGFVVAMWTQRDPVMWTAGGLVAGTVAGIVIGPRLKDCGIEEPH